VPELVGVFGDAACRIRGHIGRGYPQGQRQVDAEPREPSGSRDVGRHPLGTEHTGQQLSRFGRPQPAKTEFVSALVRHQAGQVVAAGHQYERTGGARQKGSYLLSAGGVVQYHQHAPGGQNRSVEGGRFVRVRGHALFAYTEGTKESGERGDGTKWRGTGAAVQVDVQRAVPESGLNPMRPANRQCGLPDPGHTRNTNDTHCGGRMGVVGERVIECLEYVLTTGEAGDVGWQLTGRRRRLLGLGAVVGEGNELCASLFVECKRIGQQTQ
jgi:hypothetical protein